MKTSRLHLACSSSSSNDQIIHDIFIFIVVPIIVRHIDHFEISLFDIIRSGSFREHRFINPHLDGQITNSSRSNRACIPFFKELSMEIGSNYSKRGGDSLKSIKAKTSRPVFMSHHCLARGGGRYRRQDISVDAPLMARIASKAFNRDRLFRRYHLSFLGKRKET